MDQGSATDTGFVGEDATGNTLGDGGGDGPTLEVDFPETELKNFSAEVDVARESLEEFANALELISARYETLSPDDPNFWNLVKEQSENFDA